MPASPAQRELIGLRCAVARSGEPTLAGLQGTVVDETQGTLTLATPRGEKVVPKAGQSFAFTLPDGSTVELAGRDIAHRPEDRIRKARPRQPTRRANPQSR